METSRLLRFAYAKKTFWFWIYLLCIKFSFWFGANAFLDGWRHFLEAGVYVGVLYLVSKVAPVKLILSETHPKIIFASAVFLILLISAQLARHPARHYPLLDWTMYSSSHPLAWEYSELNISSKTIPTTRLDTSRSPINHRTLFANIDRLKRQLVHRNTSVELRAQTEAVLKEVMIWTGRLDQRFTSEEPAWVELVEVKVEPDFTVTESSSSGMAPVLLPSSKCGSNDTIQP